MRLRSPRDVWKKLKETFQSLDTAAVDAKLTRLRNIQMSNKETVVEYVNPLESLVHELFEAGHTISDLKKRRTLLCDIHNDFAVVEKVIQMSDKSFTDAVSQLNEEESFKKDGESNEIAIPTRHRWYGEMRRDKRECYKCGKMDISLGAGFR